MSRKRPLWWRMTRVVGAAGEVAVTVHGRTADDRPVVLALTHGEARALVRALEKARTAAARAELCTVDMSEGTEGGR